MSVVEQNYMERGFQAAVKKAYKKRMKAVRWNEEEFESCRALARHLLVSSEHVGKCIRGGKEIKGHIPELIK